MCPKGFQGTGAHSSIRAVIPGLGSHKCIVVPGSWVIDSLSEAKLDVDC